MKKGGKQKGGGKGSKGGTSPTSKDGKKSNIIMKGGQSNVGKPGTKKG